MIERQQRGGAGRLATIPRTHNPLDVRVRLTFPSEERPAAAIEEQRRRALEELRLVEREILLLREARDRLAPLPLASNEDPEHPLSSQLPQCTTVPFGTAEDNSVSRMQLRVLVIEDQIFQQEAILNLLQVSSNLAGGLISFDTEMCSSAEEAHSLLRRRRDFHAVVLDVVMPDINGDDLIPSLRAILGEHVAVVMASAYGQISLMQRCILRGADSFMTKPLQLASISQMWQQCLAKNRLLYSAPPSRTSAAPSGGPSPAISASSTRARDGGSLHSSLHGSEAGQSPRSSTGSRSYAASPSLGESTSRPSPGYPPWHPASPAQRAARKQAAQVGAAANAAAAPGCGVPRPEPGGGREPLPVPPANILQFSRALETSIAAAATAAADEDERRLPDASRGEWRAERRARPSRTNVELGPPPSEEPPPWASPLEQPPSWDYPRQKHLTSGGDAAGEPSHLTAAPRGTGGAGAGAGAGGPLAGLPQRSGVLPAMPPAAKPRDGSSVHAPQRRPGGSSSVEPIVPPQLRPTPVIPTVEGQVVPNVSLAALSQHGLARLEPELDPEGEGEPGTGCKQQ